MGGGSRGPKGLSTSRRVRDGIQRVNTIINYVYYNNVVRINGGDEAYRAVRAPDAEGVGRKMACESSLRRYRKYGVPIYTFYSIMNPQRP